MGVGCDRKDRNQVEKTWVLDVTEKKNQVKKTWVLDVTEKIEIK